MTVVDSSGWLEVLLDGPLADEFSLHLQDEDGVLVPSIVVYEVHKVARRERGGDVADGIVALMLAHHVVDLDANLAIYAAELSLEHRLPMADAIVYATARAHDATLVTRDVGFRSLPGVEYLAPASRTS